MPSNVSCNFVASVNFYFSIFWRTNHIIWQHLLTWDCHQISIDKSAFSDFTILFIVLSSITSCEPLQHFTLSVCHLYKNLGDIFHFFMFFTYSRTLFLFFGMKILTTFNLLYFFFFFHLNVKKISFFCWVIMLL